MSKWRPEGWEQHYQVLRADIPDYPDRAFEAGADAMLEALRKLSSEQKSATQRIAELIGNTASRGKASGEPKLSWFCVPEEDWQE